MRKLTTSPTNYRRVQNQEDRTRYAIEPGKKVKVSHLSPGKFRASVNSPWEDENLPESMRPSFTFEEGYYI